MAAPLSYAQTGRKARARGSTRKNLVSVLLFLLLFYFVLPFLWLLVSSTKTNADLFTTFGMWFAADNHLLANLHDVFTYDGGAFAHWLWNTAYYATCSAIGASLIATIAGYAFAKFRFPGRQLVFAVILGSILVPLTALAIPTYLLLSKVGLIDTPLAVILPSLANPLGVYLMRIYAEQGLPDELLDAARVDGAGELRLFWSVAMRILAPGFVTILLLSFVGTWNNYYLPLLVLSKPDYYPLTVGLANWNDLATSGGGSQILFSMVITGALISIVPLIAAFMLLQRYWQNGLGLGGLKT